MCLGRLLSRAAKTLAFGVPPKDQNPGCPQFIHEGAPVVKAVLLEEELDFGVATAFST